MTSISNINSNGDSYKPNLTQEQQNLFSNFVSIFNKYDTNHDGTIDNSDILTNTDKEFVEKIKNAIDKVKIRFEVICGLSIGSITDLLNSNPMGTEAALSIAEETVFQTLDKDGNGVINEKDNLTQKEKEVLSGFNKTGETEYYIQHTKNEKFNGVNAKVTYNNNDKIIAVKTNAKNEKEAASMMGLNPPLWERHVDNQTKLVRYYYHGKDELPEKFSAGYWFEWDDKSKTMLWAGNFKNIQ